MFKLIYKLLSFLPACALACMPMACVEDYNLAQQEKKAQKMEPAVGFSGASNAPETRTSGKYGTIEGEKLGITFYWTPNDYNHMYINKGTEAAPQWEKSTAIHFIDKDADTHAATATFHFKGKYENKQYTMLYVGGDQSMSTKSKLYVNFPNEQKQASPEDGELANSGDCGVAKTSCVHYFKEGKGWGYHGDRHTFTLEHKAAYVTLLPYNPHGNIINANFVSAVISAKESIYGKFPFTEKGVDVSKRPLNQTEVSLDLTQNGKKEGQPIASNKEDAWQNAGIVVLPPGKYTNFQVTFRFKDHFTKKTFTHEQTYSVLKLDAGTNQPVFGKLNVEDFTPSFIKYTMWGAEKYYYTSDNPAPHNWNTKATGIPAPEDGRWPKDEDDQRWYSENEEADAGVPTIKAFTPNEASYILTKDCYWNPKTLWAFDGHVYQGILWVAVINKGAHKAFDGKDWTSVATTKNKESIKEEKGQPQKCPTVGYYPIPLLGRYINGELKEVGKAGYYWINGADPDDSDNKAYYIKVDKTGISINNDGDKKWGCIPFTGDIRP